MALEEILHRIPQWIDLVPLFQQASLCESVKYADKSETRRGIIA